MDEEEVDEEERVGGGRGRRMIGELVRRKGEAELGSRREATRRRRTRIMSGSCERQVE